jgi:hypothetical protein
MPLSTWWILVTDGVYVSWKILGGTKNWAFNECEKNEIGVF